MTTADTSSKVSKLEQLQSLRAEHYPNWDVFWALTVAIDILLGAPFQEDAANIGTKERS